MKIRPVNDRLLVRPFKAPEKKGLLYLPEQAQGEVLMGVVEAVGPGKGFDGPGSARRTVGDADEEVVTIYERAPITARAGDVVVYGRFSGAKVEAFGRELFLLREDELLAVVEDVPDDWKKENEEILRAAELGMENQPEPRANEEGGVVVDDIGEPPPIKLVTE